MDSNISYLFGYFWSKNEQYQLLQANLTMLYSRPKPKGREKALYFQSQLTDATPHRTSCRSISPSFCPNQQNQDRSNIKQAASYFNPKAHTRTPSLREQINQRLQQNKSKKHAASLICTYQTHDEPLSTIRKMLTQDSPIAATKVRVNKQQGQEKKRRARRAQFELRQQKLIQMKRQRQQLGQFEQLRRDIQECTFHPKLTSYHRL